MDSEEGCKEIVIFIIAIATSNQHIVILLLLYGDCLPFIYSCGMNAFFLRVFLETVRKSKLKEITKAENVKLKAEKPVRQTKESRKHGLEKEMVAGELNSGGSFTRLHGVNFSCDNPPLCSLSYPRVSIDK